MSDNKDIKDGKKNNADDVEENVIQDERVNINEEEEGAPAHENCHGEIGEIYNVGIYYIYIMMLIIAIILFSSIYKFLLFLTGKRFLAIVIAGASVIGLNIHIYALYYMPYSSDPNYLPNPQQEDQLSEEVARDGNISNNDIKQNKLP